MANRAQSDVIFTPDESLPIPLYQQIYEQARNAIVEESLQAGEKLPSIRHVSKSLGLSHTTIEKAYQQLSLEGYVRNVPRSGYVVEELDIQYLQLSRSVDVDEAQQAVDNRNQEAFFAENIQGAKARYDFSYANLPDDSFPVVQWRRLIANVLYSDTLPAFARYTNVDEPNALRLQLARYVGRARGIHCSPHQVQIQTGTDGAIAAVLNLFNREKDVLGIEEPGYATTREVAQRMGFKIVGLPVDQGSDVFIDSLYEKQPTIVFTTPSHQFPTGKLLNLSARMRLLQWADKHGAYIIEDDSCCEYRYQTSPILSLYSLDAAGRTIYLNNTSKVLSPSLRMSYLVLPVSLLERYFETYRNSHPPFPYLEQETLARFIEEGLWERHIRRMSKSNHTRHDELLTQLRDKLGNRIQIEGIDSGMHFYVTVDSPMTQEELIESAFQQGVAVYGTKRLWFERSAPENKLMIGFSSIPVEDIAPGVEALKRAWFDNEAKLPGNCVEV